MKSKSATVARVRTSMLIHMGRMNRITVTAERLSLALASIHAAGYPKRRQSTVVMSAISMEYTKV